jgi:ABC-type lipoprotein export system ATPase subunit
VLGRDCFSGEYLLFLAAENWDQIDWGGQDYLTRRLLFQKSDGLFCGQQGTIDWRLGRKGTTVEKFTEEFGSLKPCVHGSDAHSIETICKPKDDKFCWIKADPTFNGLKQIVYEPADRVYIGPSAPVYHDLARVIRSVTLTDSNDWFEDGVEISLNAGLTSIIGQKGSGKSALAELIAVAAIQPKSYMRADATFQDVLDWIYEVDHVRLSYGLKYNGADLEKLSPGTKGIVLLILYLGMDISDTRPLVIDQPDENLDNESIFKLLKKYFRDAKGRRQIILISHNPNLVVNADSEQLIVAFCERRDDGLPRITYTTGALESSEENGTGIREHACRILEGGAEAFRNRECRYSLQSIVRP